MHFPFWACDADFSWGYKPTINIVLGSENGGYWRIPQNEHKTLRENDDSASNLNGIPHFQLKHRLGNGKDKVVATLLPFCHHGCLPTFSDLVCSKKVILLKTGAQDQAAKPSKIEVSSYWKWPFIVEFPWKMVIFHSYFSLLEGTQDPRCGKQISNEWI